MGRHSPGAIFVGRFRSCSAKKQLFRAPTTNPCPQVIASDLTQPETPQVQCVHSSISVIDAKDKHGAKYFNPKQLSKTKNNKVANPNQST